MAELVAWMGTRGIDPAGLGRAGYDKARAASGLAGVPSAGALRGRFGIALADILVVAVLSPNDRTARLATLRARRDEFAGDDAQIVRALRAARLEIEGELTGIAYDAFAGRAARASRRGRRLAALLPSSRTIINRFGSWQAACLAAGLEAPRPRRVANKAAPTEQLLSRAIDRLGFIPPWRYFVELWRAEGVPVARVYDYAREIERTRAMRAGEGRWTPPRVARTAELPPLERVRRQRPRGIGASYSREQVLASLRRYAELAGPGVPYRVRHYKALRRHHPELIPPNAIQGHGRFQELLREALAGEETDR